jgi:hypothetical protein
MLAHHSSADVFFAPNAPNPRPTAIDNDDLAQRMNESLYNRWIDDDKDEE